MEPEVGEHETGVVDRLALPLAVASVLSVLAVFSTYADRPIADEAGHHLHAIRQFYEGDWSRPEHLPMFPAYHAVAAVAARVFGANLLVLRGLSAVMMIGAVVFFDAALRRRGVKHRGYALLHFAWLPLLLPFSVMVYTESASMLCLAAAIYLQSRRQLQLSALALLFACLVRQSNVVWVVLLAVLAWTEHGREMPGDSRKVEGGGARASNGELVVQLWGHAAVTVLTSVWLIVDAGGTRTIEANRPRFNVAQLYLFAMAGILLWAPLWMRRLPHDVRALVLWFRMSPARGVVVVIVAGALVAMLAIAFRNPHPWNENPRYFRNLPLMAMSQSSAVRWIVAAVIVAIAPIVVRFTLAQTDRLKLALAWMFALLFLLPHSLAEPRYYVVPFVLLNLLSRYSAAEARVMAAWYFTLSAVLIVEIARVGDAGGGVL